MEIFFLCVIGIFISYFLYEALAYRAAVFDTSGGPGLFPKYILILFLACIVVLIIQKLIRKDKDTFVFKELFIGIRGIVLLSMVVYLILTYILGFTVSTILFLIFLFNYLYYGKHTDHWGRVKSVMLRSGVGLFLALCINLIFTRLMHVFLPKGILF